MDKLKHSKADYKCSECGANADLRDWSGESPYCPWCGARMFEPQESEEQV